MKRVYLFPFASILWPLFAAVELACGQDLAPPPSPAGAATNASANVEVITHGPVHEAFLLPTDLNSAPNAVMKTAPPAPVNEVPPTIRPVGNNILWIPGYWGWDELSTDYLWISGVWRAAPPAMRWVPGYWGTVEGGYQWNSGFWARADHAQLAFYKAPPKSLEQGPSSPAPNSNHYWIPGRWQPTATDYQWHAGTWAPHQRNWVWIPAHHVATSAGSVYVAGYWDYPLPQRGQLFASARFTAASGGAGIRYTPQVAINLTYLPLHLFVHDHGRTYLYGNYYGENYAGLGIRPWYATATAHSVIDPVLNYNRWVHAERGIDYVQRLTAWNKHYVSNTGIRPALTFVEQAKLVDTHAVKTLESALLGQTVQSLVSTTPNQFVHLSTQQQTMVGAAVKQINALTAARLQLSSAVQNVDVNAVSQTAIRLPVQALQLPTALGITNNAVGGAARLPAAVGGVAPNVGNVVPHAGGVIQGGGNVIQQGVGPTVNEAVRPVDDVIQGAGGLLPDVGGILDRD